MNAPDLELPYVDEHSVGIPVARERVWSALERYAATSLERAARHPLARLLGTEPAGGFAVAESTTAERLSLVGRHRFARYRLTFELSDTAGGGTRLTATTYAAFPGVHGRVYRGLVIGTRAHVLATRHVLQSVRRSSLDLARAEQAP